MFKFSAYASSLPSIVLIYGIITKNYGMVTNCSYTIALIVVLLLIYKKFPFFNVKTIRSITVFILLSIFAGKALGLYITIPFWDKILHFLSGFIAAQAGVDIYMKFGGNKKNKGLLISFTLFFVFSVAGLWEIWEFICDKTLHMNAQNNSLDDTMYDMIAGSLSGTIKVLLKNTRSNLK